MTEIFGYLIIGVGVGLLSSFLGFGGGTLMVPMLPLIAGLPTKSAIATSLFVISLNSLRNTWSFHKKNLVDWGIIKNIIPYAILFSLASSYATSLVPIQILNWILVFIFIFLTLMTLLGPNKTPQIIREKNLRNFIISGTGVGTLSGLSGIGGGTFVIPLMISGQWALPHMVSPTGNAINFFTATFGCLMLGLNSDLIQFQPGLWILFASMLTSQWARKKQSAMSELTRRKLIVVFLLSVIIKLFWQAVSQ